MKKICIHEKNMCTKCIKFVKFKIHYIKSVTGLKICVQVDAKSVTGLKICVQVDAKVVTVLIKKTPFYEVNLTTCVQKLLQV